MSGFWLDRPVFVTGATGLVGSWLTKRLFDKKADVVILVRDWIPNSELVTSGYMDRVRIVKGDLSEESFIERILCEYEIDTVFHLAAQTLVPVANRNPISTFETNIAGTWKLLEACRKNSLVKQIIFASSDKAYGEVKQLPYKEETPLEGRYPYDVSKSCSDLIAQSYAQTYNLPVCITRCGNFYGGGDLNWNRIIPGTIRSVIRNQRPVIRSNGQSIRDYFYVEDGAAAYMLLAEKLASNRDLIGHAFNFSNELEISVIDIVNRILSLMNSSKKPDIRNNSSSEIQKQFLDASKAHRLLDWKPTFDLKSGLERAIGWYSEFFKE